MSGETYTGERRLGGELVRGPDDDLLDKHLDVVRISPGGFDWGEGADDEGLLQLAVALLAAEVDADTARQHHHRFAGYLQERLAGDEWLLPAEEICEANWRRATPFDNRADVDADTAPPTDRPGETTDTDESDVDGVPSVEDVAETAVDDVLESLERRDDVAPSELEGVTDEAVQRELRAAVRYRATEAHRDDVGAVRSEATRLLQEALADSEHDAKATTQPGDSSTSLDGSSGQDTQGQGRATSDGGVKADEFEWVSLA